MTSLIEWIDGGKIQRGTIRKEDKGKIQVASLSGKSLSLKRSRFHLRHETGEEAEAFFRAVDADASGVELELLHGEVEAGAPLEVKALAAIWFDSERPAARELSVLLAACLDGAPWFKVDSAGRVRANPEDEIERWRREREARQRDAEERERIDAILHDPAAAEGDGLRDRLEAAFLARLLEEKELGDWKPAAAAVQERAAASGQTRMQAIRAFLDAAGKLPSAYDVHMARFGRRFDREAVVPLLGAEGDRNIYAAGDADEIARIGEEAARLVGTLPPPRNAFIFSVDDETTQEIDDAISVEEVDGGRFRVGVHIAAPGIFIAEESGVHGLAASRFTTVYQPDLKWTMLPRGLIDIFSLVEGKTAPAVSTYYTVESASLEIVDVEARLEAITPAVNTSYAAIEAGLEGGFLPDLESIDDDPERVMAWLEKDPREFPWARRGTLPEGLDTAVDLLVPLARQLYLGRRLPGERPFYRLEYRIKVAGDGAVSIEGRRRNSLAEGIVSELMILTNSRMAQLLAEADLPAIYRTQRIVGGAAPPAASSGEGEAAPAPVFRRKADLTVNPREHAGLGASFYSWTTSPLRRYSDLINQRQLGSLIGGPLPAFSDPSELLVRAKTMEFQSKAADAHQRKMERFFTMKYIEERTGEAWPVFVEHRPRGTRLHFETIPFSAEPDPDAPLPPEGPALFTAERFDYHELKVSGASK